MEGGDKGKEDIGDPGKEGEEGETDSEPPTKWGKKERDVVQREVSISMPQLCTPE
jgi:hypothetical protein